MCTITLRSSMPRAVPTVALAIALCVFAGCSRESTHREHPRPESSAGRAPWAAASKAIASSAKPPPHAPGEVPFEFPAIATSAKKGDFVLAPSRNWVDEAFEQGAANVTFIYYGAWMLDPGPKQSKLKTLPGQTMTLPNAMILPVGSGESAKPGDIVLTAWASGSGLMRAIVTGGDPTHPTVRYLDIDFDNPSGWGQKDDELPEKTFHVLAKAGELGTTLACKDGARSLRWILVQAAGDKLLGLGFAGKMRVLEKKTCVDVPIAPKLTPGSNVFVPVLGSFVPAKVVKVDAAIGRVTCKHSFGGKEQEVAIGFGNVATAL
jgi:hypothetical protein